MLTKLREEAEAELDAFVYGVLTKNESEKRAEEAERKILLKLRHDENERIRSAYQSNSAKAAPLEKSESELRDEEAERKIRLKLRQDGTAVWGELMSASKSTSDRAAPRQQKRPRCVA